MNCEYKTNWGIRSPAGHMCTPGIFGVIMQMYDSIDIEIIIRYTFEWCGRANFTLRENMKNCFERINYILLVKGKMSLLILSFVCLM